MISQLVDFDRKVYRTNNYEHLAHLRRCCLPGIVHPTNSNSARDFLGILTLVSLVLLGLGLARTSVREGSSGGR